MEFVRMPCFLGSSEVVHSVQTVPRLTYVSVMSSALVTNPDSGITCADTCFAPAGTPISWRTGLTVSACHCAISKTVPHGPAW